MKLCPEEVEHFFRQADQNIQQYVTLIVEPEIKTALIELLKASTIAKTSFANSDGNMLILADTNGYGEAAHCPSVRKAPLPIAHFTKLIDAVRDVRSTVSDPPVAAGALAIGDIYCLIDAGQKNRRPLFLKLLKGTQQPKKRADGKTTVTDMMLHKTEDSVLARQKRSCGQLKLTEGVTLVYNGKHPLNLATACTSRAQHVATPLDQYHYHLSAQHRELMWASRSNLGATG